MLSGASLALTVSIQAPPDSTWFANSAITVNGTAGMPGVSTRSFANGSDFQNGTFDGTSLDGSGHVQLLAGSDATVRYFDGFDYPDGTLWTSADAMWVAEDGPCCNHWAATTDVFSIISGTPSMAAKGRDSGSSLFWRALTPAPIKRATLNFRAASERDGELDIYLSTDGRPANETHVFGGGFGLSETNASINISSYAKNLTSLFLRFTATSSSGGSQVYCAFDDLTVDLSFAKANGSSNASITDNFEDPVPDPTWYNVEGRWYVGTGGPSPNGGSLVHDDRPSSTYQSSGNATYRLRTAAAITSATLYFNYTCESGGRIQAFVGSYEGGTETQVVNSSFGVSNTAYSGDILSFVGNRTIVLRFWAIETSNPGICSVDDLNLTIGQSTDPQGIALGSYLSPSIDFGLSVNWTTVSNGSTVSGLAYLLLTFATSPDGTNWSAWSRPDSSGTLSTPAGRFIVFNVSLWSPAAGTLPSLSRVNISYFAITRVLVSGDGGSNWTLASVVSTPSAGALNWSCNLSLAPGGNNITARAFDTTGAFVESNITSSWDAFPPSAPGDPIDDGAFSNSTDLNWSWAPATDVGLGVGEYQVNLGSVPGAGDIVPNQTIGASTRFSYSSAMDGTHYYLTVRARDNASLWGPWSNSSDGILVDRVAPLAPKPSSGGAWSNSSNITWSWGSGSDLGSGIRSYEVRVGTVAGGSNILGPTPVVGQNFTLAGAIEGRLYYLTLRATDEVFTSNSELVSRLGTTQPKQIGIEFLPEEDTLEANGLAKVPDGDPLAGREIPGGAREFLSEAPVKVARIVREWEVH